MSNFEYIIASLPFLTADYRYAQGESFNAVLEEIRRDLGEKDSQSLDFLLKGFEASALDGNFYASAGKHPVSFIRDYFNFDRKLRNAKVKFLNKQLGRPEETDLVLGWMEDDELMEFPEEEFTQERKVLAALEQSDLLSREKDLDDICWEVLDNLSTFHYFDISAVLAYVAKLHIVDRWLALDEERGRELFHKLVKEVRGTFKGVRYDEK